MNQTTTQQEPTPSADAPEAVFDTSFEEFASAAAPSTAVEEVVVPDPHSTASVETAPAPTDGSGAGTEIAADDAQPAPSAEQAPTDIWATAPPELQAAFTAAEEARRAAEHRLASDNGRVAALTRQLDELRRQPPAGVQQPETPPSLKELLESDQIKAFRAEYAEVADPILDLLRAQQTQLDQLQGTAQRVEQDRASTFLDTQVTAYEAQHPDWRDYATHDKFAPWLATQPRHIQEAANRNAIDIVDAAEASDVLSRFKLDIGVASPTPTPAPNPTPTPAPNPTDAKRQQQLEASTDVRTKGPQAQAAIPDDFGSAFAAFSEKAKPRR